MIPTITQKISRTTVPAIARMALVLVCMLVAGSYIWENSALDRVHAQSSSSLYLYPANGLFTIGTPFTVEVRLDTAGQAINTAEGALTFDPADLRVDSISTENSIFTMWVTEPEFDNVKGTVRFSGGTQEGYSGSAGTLVTITLTPLRNSASEVWFSQGATAVLAADGRGSNVLGAMHTGTYTLEPREVVAQLGAVTYAAELSPGAIASPTHPDDTRWYATSTAVLEWTLPKDVTGMRTGLSENPNAAPATLYAVPVSTRTISDITDGIWYFSLQLRTADGWDEAAQKTLRVDTHAPSGLILAEVPRDDPTDPNAAFEADAFDVISGVERFEMTIDANQPEIWKQIEGDTTYEPQNVPPGVHTLTAAVFDHAGNSTSASVTFSIEALQPPEIVNPPISVMVGDTLTVRGHSYPNADVTAIFTRDTGDDKGEEERKTVRTGSDGAFALTLADLARAGTYHARFTVSDERGAVSESTEPIEIIASQPKIVLFGSIAVSYLSVIVPLIGLLFLAGFLLYLGWQYFRGFRSRVHAEAEEAQETVHDGFAWVQSDLKRQIRQIERAGASRELTREEVALLHNFQKQLDSLEKVVSKEVRDIEMVTDLRRK